MHLAKMHKLHSFGASKTKSPKTSQSKPWNIKTAPKSTTIVQESNKIHPKLNPEGILGATSTPWANFDQLGSPKSSERVENLIPKSKQIRSKVDPEGVLKATSRRNWFLDRFGGEIDGFPVPKSGKKLCKMKICIRLGFDLTFDLKTNDSDGLGKTKILQNTRRVVQKATLHMLLLMLK